MSSTEPPSRVPPRGQSQDTKAARDEISSKGKVEKVREVDADETRKRKFLKYYDEDLLADDTDTESRISPFDLASGKQPQEAGGLLGSRSSLSDVEDAIVPSPSYTPPPDVSSMDLGEENDEDDEAPQGALPQSDDFWKDVDFPPDQQARPSSYQETPGLTRSSDQPHKPGEITPKSGEKKKDQSKTPGSQLVSAQLKPEKKTEPSPFGPPGKPVKPEKKGSFEQMKGEEKKKLPTPFEQAATSSKSIKPGEKKKEPSPFAEAAPKARALEKEEERYLGPPSTSEKSGKKEAKEKTKEQEAFYQEPGAIPHKADERESGGGGGGKRERVQKIVEIDAPSLPVLPTHIQPIALEAATKAVSYIHPSTASLFFQMVGTMYVMVGQQGINRTEIVLNNPSFANSKFFGATIKIEKYATAPDSFNITLSGSREAVVSFKENIPSLMSAFQNGNFTFKVNRLDVEYAIEKPVYRRKEKGDEKGDAAGGDLGERRK